ncbi:MAG TPA: hypothetical protein VNT20_18275 [Flavisolibacter sp.]|jgi:hypothetical protein|nr:hypothetical protein [Flavisolibacter sp.]
MNRISKLQKVLDGGSIYAPTLRPSQVKYLQKRLTFSRTVEGHGKEVAEHNVQQEYKGFHWRRAEYRFLNISLGWKRSPFTDTKIWALKINGSIHKYARGDNDDFFSADDAVKALFDLCNDLKIDPAKAKITSLEIGVNLQVPFEVVKYLEDNLVRFEGKRKRLFNLEGKVHVAELTHYGIKLYPKDKNTLRYEVYWEDMQQLREQYSLFTISSVSPTLINQIAEEQLILRFSQIVFLNNIDLITEIGERSDGMKSKELDLIRKFCINQYVRQYENKIHCAGGELKESLYKEFQRQRGKAFKLLEKYGQGFTKRNLHDQIQTIIAASKEITDDGKCVQFLKYR